MDKINTTFAAQVYGDLVPYEKNSLMSKARLRIFYKGLNRNRTFITDQFADKLLSSLPYTPISGIYEEDEGDFTNHGKSREEGKIYGIVPENPNVAFEPHLDKDGVTREYACCDVVLFTTRYENANKIVGKSHSMEIYKKSIKGVWKAEGGEPYYEFTDGKFIGLQVLGDKVEPCFEGSEFYTLTNIIESLEAILNEIQNYSKDEGGNSKMKINFNLSDSDKFGLIFDKLNPNCNDEGNWMIDYSIMDIYDDYALCFKYEDGSYCRVYYTKDNEQNSVELGEIIPTYIIDVTEKELSALKALRNLNGETYENVDEHYSEAINSAAAKDEALAGKTKECDDLNALVDESKATIDSLVETNNSLIDANKTLNEKNDTLTADLNTLTEERDSLKDYKLSIERQEKLEAIEKFNSLIDAEVLTKYQEEVDNYTLVDLKKELSSEYVAANVNTIFSKNNGNKVVEPIIPVLATSNKLTGAAKLIQDYKNSK